MMALFLSHYKPRNTHLVVFVPVAIVSAIMVPLVVAH
jgi:hypothetical protein